MVDKFESPDNNPSHQLSAQAKFAGRAALVRADILDTSSLDGATATMADLGTANALLALAQRTYLRVN